MNIKEALKIYNDFNNNNGDYNEEDLFMFTEAAKYLIEETDDPEYMFFLGAVYYENQFFDLALKYYEMAAERDYEPALLGLGYIWYYGRTGTVDYKKAFEYYSKTEHNVIAQYKIADMYKNGLYVPQDYHRYKEIIESLYPEVRYTDDAGAPLPEICIRLAEIRENDGDIDEAIRLLREGKSMLISRIQFDPFYGNLSIMNNIIDMLYRLSDFNKSGFDFFDLFHLFKEPVKVSFSYKGKNHIIESVKEQDDSVSVCLDGKWYRTFKDLLTKARLNDVLVTIAAEEMKDFSIVE